MTTPQPHAQFSLLPFLYTNTLILLFIFGFLKIFFPGVWQLQLTVPWHSLLITFVCIHLVASFVEYFFHRYVLHMEVLPFFSHFYQQHNIHHAHTSIERDGLYVTNRFPIEEAPQYEASFFPWWSLLAFSAFLTPLFIIAHFLLPTQALFLTGYTAVFFSMLLYELFHAAWHWPLSRWNTLFQKKYTGAFWNMVYTFHLRHHANVRCNESVSGFFGIPLADLLFRTYMKSNTLYPHKHVVDAKEFEAPRPIWFIRWLDTVCLSISNGK